MPEQYFRKPEFCRYISLMLDLHRQEDDEEAAERTRDLMDSAWEDLTDEEQATLRGLSADLAWAWDGPPDRPLQREDVQREDMVRLARLSREGNQESQELLLLRKCSPLLQEDMVAYRRGRIWGAGGHPALAQIFFEQAAKLNPNNLGYSYMALLSLAESDRPAAQASAQKIIQQPDQAPLGELVESLILLFPRDKNSDVAPLIRAADEAILRLLGKLPSPDSENLLATACLIGGLCYLLQDRRSKAHDLFRLGLEMGRGLNHSLLDELLADRSPIGSTDQLASIQARIQPLLAA